MAKSKMVNFRVKEEDFERIQKAADLAGMDRSDFCRKAIGDSVRTLLGGGEIKTVGVRGPARQATRKLDEGCPNNPYCRFIKDAALAPTCVTCGSTK